MTVLSDGRPILQRVDINGGFLVLLDPDASKDPTFENLLLVRPNGRNFPNHPSPLILNFEYGT